MGSASGALRVPAWSGLGPWLAEIDRQGRMMRASRPHYDRFDETARLLTAVRIRSAAALDLVEALHGRLDRARRPTGDLHGLDRVWSRAELGVLLVEATNRVRLLRMGRLRAKAKGPALDPDLIPDDRLLHVIQHHRDLAVVEALRRERARRQGLDCAG